MRLNGVIRAEYDRVRAAELARDKAIERICAVGSRLNYRRGRYVVPVEVLGHSGDRLKVRALASDRVYWISASRVV